MNIDAKMLSGTLGNPIQYHITKIHHNPSDFIPSMQRWYNTHKSINVIYNIGRLKVRSHTKILRGEEKAFDKNPTSL